MLVLYLTIHCSPKFLSIILELLNDKSCWFNNVSKRWNSTALEFLITYNIFMFMSERTIFLMFHSSNLYLGWVGEHCKKKDKDITTSMGLESYCLHNLSSLTRSGWSSIKWGKSKMRFFAYLFPNYKKVLCNYCINLHWTCYVSAWICVGALIAPSAQTISMNNQ